MLATIAYKESWSLIDQGKWILANHWLVGNKDLSSLNDHPLYIRRRLSEEAIQGRMAGALLQAFH